MLRKISAITLVFVIGMFSQISLSSLFAAERDVTPLAERNPVIAPKPVEISAKVAATVKKYLLRYQFQKGEQVYYKVNHKTRMHSRLGEAIEIAENESSIRKHYRVLTVDQEQNAMLELMIDSVKMKASYDGGDSITYDSETDETHPRQFKHIEETIGRPLARIKISPQGKLISVPHVDPTLKKQSDLFDKGVQSVDNDPSRNFLVVFPEIAIAVGDTWEDRISVPFAVSKKLYKSAKLLRRYKLESVAGSLATIELKTSLLTVINDPTIRVQLIQRTPSGTITFDMQSGKITGRKLDIDKLEIGALGPKSTLHAVSSVSEQLLDVTKVARKP